MNKYRKYDTSINKHKQSTIMIILLPFKTNKYIHSITVNDVWLQCMKLNSTILMM